MRIVGYVMIVILIVIAHLIGVAVGKAWPAEIDNKRLADAIFKAEGGYEATYLYGIRSVKYKDEAEARQICLNTIKNNKVRYAEYGHLEYDTYLEFLASRYCPTSGDLSAAERRLNRNFLKNVRFFYDRPRK